MENFFGKCIKKKYTIFIGLCFVIHAAFLFFNMWTGVTPLVYVNLASSVFYLVILLSGRSNCENAIVITYCEIVLFSTLNAMILGVEVHGSLFILAMMTGLVFMAGSDLPRMYILQFIGGIVFFLLHNITLPLERFQPYVRAAEKYMKFYSNSNLLIALFSVVVISVLFSNSAVRTRRKLDYSANHDALSRLYNRHYLAGIIRHFELGEVKRCGILMLDIDDFKKINDTYGHDTGDQVIRYVAKTMENVTRESDICCRWGGEEFLVLIPEIGKEQVGLVGEKIRKAVAAQEAEAGTEKIPVTVTIGTAFYDGRDNFKIAIGRADKNLYKGKEKGKNIVV